MERHIFSGKFTAWFDASTGANDQSQLMMELILSFGNRYGFGDTSLRQEFPRLYMLSLQENVLISEMTAQMNDGEWSFIFKRRLRVWEEELLRELKLKFNGFILDCSTRRGLGLEEHGTDVSLFIIRCLLLTVLREELNISRLFHEIVANMEL